MIDFFVLTSYKTYHFSCRVLKKMGSKILKFDHIKRPGNHIPQVRILIEFWSASCERIGVSNKNVVMWVKQCHKPPMFFFFSKPIYGDLGDGLFLFYPHYTRYKTHIWWRYDGISTIDGCLEYGEGFNIVDLLNGRPWLKSTPVDVLFESVPCWWVDQKNGTRLTADFIVRLIQIVA